MANLTKGTLATMGWEIKNNPSYNPDLTPSDFHSSGPMKVHFEDRNIVWTNEGASGGQKFQIYEELKGDVLTWLRRQGNASVLPEQ
jgi:hypothetical protein